MIEPDAVVRTRKFCGEVKEGIRSVVCVVDGVSVRQVGAIVKVGSLEVTK